MKQCFINEYLHFLATLCIQKEKTISIAGKLYFQLRYFRFRCRSRSHKRSKFSSKCGPTFSSPCTWRTAGGYIDNLKMSLSNKSIPDFWYYLRNITNGLDNREFRIFYNLMTRLIVLPVYCIRKSIFTWYSYYNKYKFAKTETVWKEFYQSKYCHEAAIKTVIGHLSLNYREMSLIEYVTSVT